MHLVPHSFIIGIRLRPVFQKYLIQSLNAVNITASCKYQQVLFICLTFQKIMLCEMKERLVDRVENLLRGIVTALFPFDFLHTADFLIADEIGIAVAPRILQSLGSINPIALPKCVKNLIHFLEC